MAPAESQGAALHVATWNVNSIRTRLGQLERWLGEASPDVVCLQETKCEDAHFPREALEAAGYPHLAVHGQRTYNGVAIASRLPLDEVASGFQVAGAADAQARLIRARAGGVLLIDCYVPNGNRVGSEKFSYKLTWLARLRRELEALDPTDKVVLLGDLNVALSDLDVHDPFSAEGEVLYHPAEREAVGRLLQWGLVDAYRHQQPKGTEFTWWDYRAGAVRYNQGFRIDHVFVSEPLLPAVTEVKIWREVRRWDKPSDHVPVSLYLDG